MRRTSSESYEPTEDDENEDSTSNTNLYLARLGISPSLEPLHASKPHSKTLREYQAVRSLNFREDEHGTTVMKDVSGHNNVASWAQTRGEEQTPTCTRCHRGLGPFKTCVVANIKGDALFGGACVNCGFNRGRQRCDFHNRNTGEPSLTSSKDESHTGFSTYEQKFLAEASEMANRPRRAGSSKEQYAILPGEHVETGNRLQIPLGTSVPSPAHLQTLKRKTISTSPSNAPPKRSSSLTGFSSLAEAVAATKKKLDERKPHRLDGQQQPFPFTNEHFQDAKLLKEAICDLESFRILALGRLRELDPYSETENTASYGTDWVKEMGGVA